MVDPPERPAAATMTYAEAIRQATRDAMRRDARIIVLGQGVDDHKGTFGSTLGLAAEFGRDRVMDVPVAEEGLTGIAVGAALNGLYPVQTHIRVDFALLAMNQIVNVAAKYRYMYGGRFEVPLLIRLIIGRSWGQGAQHSQSLQAIFAHVPGLTVLMPSSAQAVIDQYPAILGRWPGPVVSLEHRLLFDLAFRVEPGGTPAPLFGSRLARRGSALTVVATSVMVLESLRAAEHLARAAGIECEVIDLNCVSRPDVDLVLESVERSGRLLVADTGWSGHGVAAEMCRLVCERNPGILQAPVVSVGPPPAPCPTAKALEDLYYPSTRRLCDAMAALASGTPEHGVPLPPEASMADVYRSFKGPF